MTTTDHAQPKTPRRVLIVDDSPDVADSLALLLSIIGATVRVAYSGAGGLAACAEFAPELVLLDISMPDMDGFETARRMRALPAGKNAVLVALSGRGEEETRSRVESAGFDRHLSKPADLGELEFCSPPLRDDRRTGSAPQSILPGARDPGSAHASVRRLSSVCCGHHRRRHGLQEEIAEA